MSNRYMTKHASAIYTASNSSEHSSSAEQTVENKENGHPLQTNKVKTNETIQSKMGDL